ncbi:hypothetical protein VZT92_003941 [Zoarces viviparus]|uniref:Uncharacterized protein n=1 Tax=Zoarces viviparus TaxID=48416 RepID=A0AAW1FVB7_ZOAVI
MCHRLDDVMKLCCALSANQQIQTTVKGSGKGAAAAAGGLAFAGGLVGGPLGITVGGAQQKLHGRLLAVLGDIQWTDLAQLTALVMGNATLKQQLTATLLGYISKELQAQVHYVD